MVPKKTLTIAWYFFSKSLGSVYFRCWNVCSTTPCIQWCFLGVLVAAAMKIYSKWSLHVHRRATNASHWQLVSRKAFYFAVSFSAAALLCHVPGARWYIIEMQMIQRCHSGLPFKSAVGSWEHCDITECATCYLPAPISSPSNCWKQSNREVQLICFSSNIDKMPRKTCLFSTH